MFVVLAGRINCCYTLLLRVVGCTYKQIRIQQQSYLTYNVACNWQELNRDIERRQSRKRDIWNSWRIFIKHGGRLDFRMRSHLTSASFLRFLSSAIVACSTHVINMSNTILTKSKAKYIGLHVIETFVSAIHVTVQKINEKSTRRKRKHCALVGCNNAEPKIFAPPQTPSRGRGTAKI